MERAAAPTQPTDRVTFRDGIGDRRCVLDPDGQESRELLSIRAELTSVPAFEFALRERVSRVASFRHAYYAHVRSVERLNEADSSLGLLSDRVQGIRLSELFNRAATRGLSLDVNAAICLIRQLVPAVAKLHESSRDIAHAALGPERVVITPNARLVITEYAMGAALEQLRYSQERYWKDLRIALPRSAGLPHFDQRADVTQIGVIALSLILGRMLRDDEYPSRVGDVVAAAWAVSAKGGFEPLPPGIRGWLGRSLQLDARNSFANAIEANAELERVLGDSEYIGLPASLESFLERYHAAEALEEFVAEAIPMPDAELAAAVQAPEMTGSFLAQFIEETQIRTAADEPPTLAAPPPSLPAVMPKAVKPPMRADAKSAPSPQRSEPAPRPEPIRETASADQPIATLESLVAATSVRPAMFGDIEPPPAGRWSKTSLAVAAAVLVLVAVGVPLGRRFVMAAPAEPTTGVLVIATDPPGATAVIDGKPSGTTPVTLTLIAGSHTVELRGTGEPRSVPVMITAGTQMSQYIEMPKAAALVGQLNVRSEPAGATVTVDGVRRGTTPTVVSDLEPGEHSVVLDSDAGSVKQTVTIESGAAASLFVPLLATPTAAATGWLSVGAPIELQIRQSDRVLGTSLSDRILLPVGRHDLELVNDVLGFRTARSVQVTSGKLSALKVDIPAGTIALNALPWADVWLDGERIGETPIGNLAVPIGVHDLVLRHPELGEQHHQLTVTLKGVARLSVDLRKK